MIPADWTRVVWLVPICSEVLYLVFMSDVCMASVDTSFHTGRRTYVEGMTHGTPLQPQWLRALSDGLQAFQKGKLLKLTISWGTPSGAIGYVQLGESPASRQMNGVGLLLLQTRKRCRAI